MGRKVNAERWMVWFVWPFVIGLVVYLVAGAILGLPHGLGHSIESMTPIQTLHDMAFPVWTSGLVGIIGLLAVKAFQSLRGPNQDFA